jgi:hypothetical protein
VHTLTRHRPYFAAGGQAGARAAGGSLGSEEDILQTIAALEAQTRFATAAGGDDSVAGPSDGLPPGMDEASYQAMLSQVRRRRLRASWHVHPARARAQRSLLRQQRCVRLPASLTPSPFTNACCPHPYPLPPLTA